MAKQRHRDNQLAFSFGEASLSVTANLSEHPVISDAPLPPAVSPEQHETTPLPIPVPQPLRNAVDEGVFGRDDNDDPIEPETEEVHEISRQHGERLAELYALLQAVKESLAKKQAIGRGELVREKERLTCQIQGLLGFYAEDFGEIAARHLESWARNEAHLHAYAEKGRPITPETAERVSTVSQYAPGHPWHYLSRGDGQRPMLAESIPAASCDGDFVGKLPKDIRKRRAVLRQLLTDQSRQVEDDKARYSDILQRGASALSEYDRNIAYGGDTELAVASSIALKFNHIHNGLGRVRWLKEKLGLPNDCVDRTRSSNVEAASPTPVVGSLKQTETHGTDRKSSTQAEKLEKLEKLHEKVEDALNQLAESLEAGRSDALTTWLKTMSRFHNYSFGNQMLIAFQKPDATHVAGFHAWKKFNRLVRKGERGIMILAPVTRVVGTAQEKDGQGEVKETSVRKLVNTKVVYVFDVSQTHGEPLRELTTAMGNPAAFTPKLKDLIASRGIELYFADRASMGGAQGRSEGGRIGIQTGLAPAEEFRTLAHELAHELLHRGERRNNTTKRSRELEAESVAFVVCSAIGLDARQTSTDYIQLYRGNKATLLESLQFIRKVSQEILSELFPKSACDTETSS